MSKENQRITTLLKKYAQNKCTPDEIQELTGLFKRNEISENDLDVESILDSLSEDHSLDKEKAETIYQEVLRLRTRDKNFSRPRLKNRIAFAMAVAAIFVGIFSYVVLNDTSNYSQRPALDSLIADENILFETGVSQIEISLNNSLSDSIITINGQVIAKLVNNTIFLQQKNHSSEIEYSTLKVPFGKQIKVVLSDGTGVDLNAGTEFRFPNYFPSIGNREVELKGEAYFEVSKDKAHPFIVQTEKLDVEVLGTQFNISAYQQEFKTNVVLVEGSVKIDFQSKANGLNNTILLPGEMAVHNSKTNTNEVNTVLPEIYTSWKEGELIFRNIEFDQLLKRLERHYNVKIVNGDKELGKEILNANFGNASIEQVFDYFNEIHEINYEITNNKIVIKK